MSTPARSRDELTRALNRAMREVSGQAVIYSQAVAGRLGVNGTDLECLGVIAHGQAVTAGALAKATGLTSGAITGVIDRLERAGLARREPDPSDRRKVRVRPTEAVRDRVAPLFAPMERAAMDALAGYDDAALALILEFLERQHGAALQAVAALQAAPAAPSPGRAD